MSPHSIAAFIGGMAFGNTLRHPCTFLFEFMETEGQLLMLITFIVFGAALLPEALAHMNSTFFLYAVLSLTVIRMIPIAISLIGAGVRVPMSKLYGRLAARMGDCEENRAVAELPLREGLKPNNHD